MSFGSILQEVASRQKTVIVYTPDPTGNDLGELLSTRNLSIDYRTLPTLSADAFVIIRDDGEFHGALSLSDLLEFLSPPIRRPADLDSLDPEHRAVYDLLDNTVFISLDRRQLLATSRELEDRAWRTGHGRLHVGFQRVEAFEAQAQLYWDLATTTDIAVHVYLPAGAPASLFENTPVTVHSEPAEEITRYWFILFDDGRDGTQNCALIARERDDDRYRGVWTYDTTLVSRAFEAIE